MLVLVFYFFIFFNFYLKSFMRLTVLALSSVRVLFLCKEKKNLNKRHSTIGPNCGKNAAWENPAVGYQQEKILSLGVSCNFQSSLL